MRKKQYTESLSLVLNQETYERLQALSAQSQVSIAQIIRGILQNPSAWNSEPSREKGGEA